MNASAIGLMLVVMVIGGYAGWHIRHAYGANADLKVHKNRIPNFRRVRTRSGLISVGLVALTLLALHDLMKK